MSEHPTKKRLGFFTRILDDVAPGERYRLAQAQIVHAEAHGFDSAWIAQHHFHADEGGLPSPTVFLAHVAASTRRIRLGTGVITLPLESPLRVAEDTAVADLLSGGRLEVGFGTGGTRESFEAFGIARSMRAIWRSSARHGPGRTSAAAIGFTPARRICWIASGLPPSPSMVRRLPAKRATGSCCRGRNRVQPISRIPGWTRCRIR